MEQALDVLTHAAARHLLLDARKPGGYGVGALGDKLHPADAGMLAAIVIVVGVGFPLCCYFRKGCMLWEARRAATEQRAMDDHQRWTESGGTVASWIARRKENMEEDAAPLEKGGEKKKKQGGVELVKPSAPPRSSLRRGGAAPTADADIEAPLQPAAPAGARPGMFGGRFGRGGASAAAPAPAAAPMATPMHEEEDDFDDDFSDTATDYTQSTRVTR